MVTVTSFLSILYTPLTPPAEKLPDVSFPLKSASFSIAALLALATNVPGSFAETKLNVLGILRLLSPLMNQHFDGRVRHVRVLPVWLADNLRSAVCQPAKHRPGPIGLCDRGYAEFPRTSYTGNWVSENFVCRKLNFRESASLEAHFPRTPRVGSSQCFSLLGSAPVRYSIVPRGERPSAMYYREVREGYGSTGL